MKCFTVDTSLNEGINIVQHPFPHISLGRRGRNQWETKVFLGNRDFSHNVETILDAGIIHLKSNNKYLIVAPRTTARYALMVLKTPAGRPTEHGFSGTTKWRGLNECTLIANGTIFHKYKGSNDEMLIVVPPYTRIEVERYGMLSEGEHKVHTVYWDGVKCSMNNHNETILNMNKPININIVSHNSSRNVEQKITA
jgi:hypothetical protein